MEIGHGAIYLIFVRGACPWEILINVAREVVHKMMFDFGADVYTASEVQASLPQDVMPWIACGERGCSACVHGKDSGSRFPISDGVVTQEEIRYCCHETVYATDVLRRRRDSV